MTRSRETEGMRTSDETESLKDGIRTVDELEGVEGLVCAVGGLERDDFRSLQRNQRS